MISAVDVQVQPHSAKVVKVKVLRTPEEPIKGPITAVAGIGSSHLPIMGNESIVEIQEDSTTSIIVSNISETPIIIPKNLFVGAVEQVDLSQCKEVKLDFSEKPRSVDPGNERAEGEKAKMLEETIRDQVSHLPKPVQDRYVNLILRNHDVFSKDKFDLGRTDVMEHKIRLRTEEPIYQKQFRIPEAHRQVLLEHLKRWLDLKVVKPCTSHYNSPIFMVPKKNNELRPVLDFRRVNSESFVDKYSAREVQECVDEVGRNGSKIFSSLDLTSGFWQLPLEEASQQFTAFTIPGIGSYAWCVTPMGLLGSPASFARLMDFVMRDLAVICYQDDVLSHSKDHESQVELLQSALNRLRGHKLKLNLKKCSIGQDQVGYLGFTLTAEGVLPGTDKTKAIQECPPPKSVQQVKQFTGLVNYFRSSIPNFSRLAAPLHVLTRRDHPWNGGPLPEVAMTAFKKLKEVMTNPPILAYPNPDLPYVLAVDASAGTPGCPGGLGACLMQFDDKECPRAIGFASRALAEAERNYTTYMLELSACVFGIEHFSVYLKGREFTLQCDHRPLETTKTSHTKSINRLKELMNEYHFKIEYNPGSSNTVADFLSRNPVSAVDIGKKDLVELQSGDPLIAKIKEKLREGPEKEVKDLREQVQIKNGVVFAKHPSGTTAIFAPQVLVPQILQAAHNSRLGGHMGLFKTSARILEKYYWPSMLRDIKEHIRLCQECQRTKPWGRPNRVPLKPLEQPPGPNHRIHIDLFGPLATSGSGKKMVMVITDAFTKYVEIVALRSKRAEEVAKAIMDVWITRYTCPVEIVTDGGGEFVNQLSDAMYRELAILHKVTSPYHPQTNGRAECFNRTMRHYLQTATEAPHLDWEDLLPGLRICYNTSVSKATKATPFSLVFGMEPRMPFFDLDMCVKYDEQRLDSLSNLELLRKLANESNLKYKSDYAKYYNKRFATKVRKIREGDDIYVENSHKVGPNKKLQKSFNGPFPLVKIDDQNVWYRTSRGVKVSHLDRVKVVQASKRNREEMESSESDSEEEMNGNVGKRVDRRKSPKSKNSDSLMSENVQDNQDSDESGSEVNSYVNPKKSTSRAHQISPSQKSAGKNSVADESGDSDAVMDMSNSCSMRDQDVEMPTLLSEKSLANWTLDLDRSEMEKDRLRQMQARGLSTFRHGQRRSGPPQARRGLSFEEQGHDFSCALPPDVTFPPTPAFSNWRENRVLEEEEEDEILPQNRFSLDPPARPGHATEARALRSRGPVQNDPLPARPLEYKAYGSKTCAPGDRSNV